MASSVGRQRMSTRPIQNEPSDYNERDKSPAPQPLISSWLPIDLGPVLRGEYVAPVPTVLERNDGVALFYPACVNSLMGETESCKTWVALIAIEQELHLGHHVMLIDFEGSSASIVARLRDLGVNDLLIEGQFSYVRPDRVFTELEQALVEEAIENLGTPSLVIIDGITEAMAQAGLDPNVGTEVTKFYDQAPRWFSRLGSAVVLIDHVTKGSDNRGRFAIGSERKISGLDGAAYMVDLVTPFGRGKTGRVKLTVSKDRGGYIRQHTSTTNVIAEVVLRSSLDDGSITTSIEAPQGCSTGPFRPTFVMEQMSKALEASPDGLGTLTLRSVVKCKTDTKALAIELLVNEGFFYVKPGPKNSKVHTSLKPYREADEGADKGGDDDLL